MAAESGLRTIRLRDWPPRHSHPTLTGREEKASAGFSRVWQVLLPQALPKPCQSPARTLRLPCNHWRAPCPGPAHHCPSLRQSVAKLRHWFIDNQKNATRVSTDASSSMPRATNHQTCHSSQSTTTPYYHQITNLFFSRPPSQSPRLNRVPALPPLPTFVSFLNPRSELQVCTVSKRYPSFTRSRRGNHLRGATNAHTYIHSVRLQVSCLRIRFHLAG